MGIDPVTAALLAQSLGTVYSATAGGPKVPGAKPPPSLDAQTAAKQAAAAAAKQKQDAQAAAGYASTIKTGPSGIGSAPATGVGAAKTLIGQ